MARVAKGKATANGSQARKRLKDSDQSKPSMDISRVSHRRPNTKLAKVIQMLRKPTGASIESMMTVTGWQAHSVRGAMSGAIKKKLGLNVISENKSGKRVYRIG